MRDASPGFADTARAPAMRPVIDLAQRAARSSAHVLITGESGAGKRSLARWIHASGPRGAGPLIAIGSAALGDALLAGQSAAQAHAIFRDAAGGTLVIDELSELPYEAQAALVQLLDQLPDQRPDPPALRPAGTEGTRVIATTRHAARGGLRTDLYYAIAVIAIAVPPLRERAADIPALVARLLARHARAVRITDAALAQLAAAPWPGNVRELEATIERALALSDDGRDDPASGAVIDVAQLAPVAWDAPGAPATSPDLRGRRWSPR